jgi:hypothetical protein
VIGDAQARLPGLRPCGFHFPYEAAAWAALTQRLRIAQAASTWIFQAVRPDLAQFSVQRLRS